MHASEPTTAIAVKAAIYGGTMPIGATLLSMLVVQWLAWGITAAVWTALFHWLPPRIHQGLTPARSLALCLAAGVLASGALALLNALSR